MNLNKQDFKIVFYFVALFLGLEIISALGFLWPFLNIIFFFLVLVGTIYFSIKKLEYGLFIVLAELIIGSKGYLFFLPINDNISVSLRLALWSAYMLIFSFYFLKQIRQKYLQAEYLVNLKNFYFKKQYLFLSLAVVIGLVSAILYKNEIGNIFFDFNAWLYFLLIFPIISLKPDKHRLILVIFSSVFWISLKTLLLLGIFSYNHPEFSVFIYRWLRKTLVGEMTLLTGWNRVFIQSQIFVVITYFFLLFYNLKFANWKNFQQINFWVNLIFGGLFTSTIIISLSRSFWLAALVALSAALIFIAVKYSIKSSLKSSFFVLMSLVFGFFFIWLATPFNSSVSIENQLIERVSEKNEAALSSRWSLLPKLLSEIKKNPVTGQGFGATVTYISQDPRVLEQNQEGLYTTYAFEWGYFDIWLKIGMIGLLAYLWLLWSLFRSSWQLGWRQSDNFYFALLTGLIFLTIVHMFTPYLNHPLGIGFILIASCLISQNKVY